METNKVARLTMNSAPVGKKFNLLQRAVGEAKGHVTRCTSPEEKKALAYISCFCRGCPAGCFEKVDYEEKE